MDEPKIKNMEEFAAVSGISRPTISKYFNDPDSVRKSTRRKIEAALDRFDYRPNMYAMNQNRRLTKNIGVVVPYLADPFFAEIARIIENHVLSAGYRPVLLGSHGDPDLEIDNLENLRLIKPAGVLLAPLGRVSDAERLAAFCADVPTVLFDANIEDLGAAFVGSDNDQSIGLIVEYLCRTGAPPAFFEIRNPVNPNANKRRQSYLKAMEDLGFEPQVFSVEGEGWHFEEVGRKGGHMVLSSGEMNTNTMLCSNDRLAIGFLTACYEKGLKVGRGPDCAIRVAGQDDHPFSRYTCPSLTTVSQDYEAIAASSVETMMGLIDSGERLKNREDTWFEGRLIMRGSA